MTAVNVCIHFLFVVVAFTEVAGWTYDLEEVRRFFDEQQKKEEYWKMHHESENKDERLVENSTYKYESVYGDRYSHGSYGNHEGRPDHDDFYHHPGSHGGSHEGSYVNEDPHQSHGIHENGDFYATHGSYENHDGRPENGHLYHRPGSHENGDTYHNRASHENGDSYHNHNGKEDAGHHPYHGSNEHTNPHSKHGSQMHRGSHYNYGSPGHMESDYNLGLHQEFSHYNHLKPYKGESRKYADGYGYESYMGLKLHGIMHNGTRYLEGLRLAIENFKRMVENCTISTVAPFPGFRYNGTAPGMEIFNSSGVQGLNSNMQWPQIFNMTAAMLGFNTSNPLQRARDAIPGAQRLDTSRCANATRDREHVRRLADLAMHTVRQLQDLAMKKRHKDHKHEEIELLVRLAWFLERIAHITGFDPDAERFAPTEGFRQVTAGVTQNPLALNVSDEVKQQMMDCVRQNSTVPATVRCNIPVDMPPIMRMTFNIPENNNEGSPVLSNPAPEPAGGLSPTDPPLPAMVANPMPVTGSPMSNLPQIPGNPPTFTPGSLANQMPNLAMFPGTPSDLPPLSVIGLPNANPSGPPPLDAVQSATDQTSNMAPLPRAVRSIRKRSTDEPMLKVIKYYVKHKVWTGSNAGNSVSAAKDDLDVDNGISTPKSVQKRSVHKMIHSKRDRINDNVRYKRLHRHNRLKTEKRSVKYQDWVINRQSEDPQQDISYYIKNKPGTNIMASLVGVAEARLALERIFQTGNIEVVRRYGANYNPAIPSPFYFGLVKTLSDI